MAGEGEPIVINNDGETIVPVATEGRVARKKFTNDDTLRPTVGYHAPCSGDMIKHDISETHFVISCRLCSLRVAVPNIVKTYGDLREHFNVLRGNY